MEQLTNGIQVAKILGYSNDINPFGDANLLTPFVWSKKKDEEQKDKKSAKKDKKDQDKRKRDDSDDDKRIELLEEIEKVRKRRQDRENELAELERLRDEEQRLREMASFGDWQRKEEDFHLDQTRERSKLRILEGRERIVDEVVRNMLLVVIGEKVLKAAADRITVDPKDVEFLHLDATLSTPSDLISHIHSLSTLEELLEDIRAYEQLDEQKMRRFLQVWPALRTIAMTKKKQLQQLPHMTSALHQSIVDDVKDLLRGKTMQQLDKLEKDIKSHLEPGQAVDVEYWELMLDEVILQRAVGDVNHWSKMLHHQWTILQQELREKGIVGRETRPRDDRDDDISGGTSNKRARRAPQTVDDLAMQQYLRDADVDLDEDGGEIQINEEEEVALPSSIAAADWQELGDKFKPRKPRYFNRVKTGWDRTKYNMTHYDSDNPPPKVIQGYKFTIFYPDLLDKTKTPKFVLEPCADATNNEFVIIRFTAGAPYEDIAFKILNREWDKHRRSGYLCIFDRGILQLHFNFKKVFYRR